MISQVPQAGEGSGWVLDEAEPVFRFLLPTFDRDTLPIEEFLSSVDREKRQADQEAHCASGEPLFDGYLSFLPSV